MENEAIISFEDFGFQYTAQAEPTLYDINLQIRKGEKVLIAGPSGCGKSTLAHCINGLVPNSYPGKATGKLTICGKNALELGLFGLSKIVGKVLHHLRKCSTNRKMQFHNICRVQTIAICIFDKFYCLLKFYLFHTNFLFWLIKLLESLRTCSSGIRILLC